ncbi:hypothetical protein HRbin02_00718 [Candidatus Calditenuaceae archaeon HR02]|nr:hypothetical protein HRbin02_00718 [Candidatus Calditenuaceae archaeon HR02]
MIGTTLLYITKIGKMVPPPEILTQMVQASRRFMRGYVSGVGGWELDTVILAAAIATLTLGGRSVLSRYSHRSVKREVITLRL